ncbi:neurogenic locus notch homolog protein [Seminavis robusta]|uniref:Neurogenic locus notch homolog protein n=1 Tax=Seminavis robusta TaxID=568900 RepID=A0A9N8HYM5_9STRA|nr:neurogenic locus notch homolog protein [Seminavis robusta]|eukprot:Sro2908_g340060.1 neurogenic locus notch homolog protein (242) ;mRNA; r:4145-4870
MVFHLQSSSLLVVQANEMDDTCNNDTQCENGGVCAEPNENHSYKYCHCAVGFAGIRCNSFCPLQCQNGGYCRYHQMSEPRFQVELDRNPDDYVCQCFGLFEGKYCEIPYMNCGDGTKCYNGGTCLFRAGAKSVCECPPGFGGEKCQSTVAATDSEQSAASIIDDFERGFHGNKTALVCSILLIIVTCAGLSWYSITYCLLEDDDDEEMKDDSVPYEAVEITEGTETDTDLDISMPTWRNVV